MKNIRAIITIFIFSMSMYSLHAQSPFMNKLKNTTWIFGLGDHIVADGGNLTSYPFNPKAFNIVPFPSRITVDGYFQKGWSFQTEFAYTQYKVGNIMDQFPITKTGTYFGADFNAKFAFSHWAKKEGWFDPYATVGYGFTYRSLASNIVTGNNNVGLGFNFWIYKGFGINLQAVDKFVMKGGSKSNYAQYSFSIIYKLLAKKRNIGDK